MKRFLLSVTLLCAVTTGLPNFVLAAASTTKETTQSEKVRRPADKKKKPANHTEQSKKTPADKKQKALKKQEAPKNTKEQERLKTAAGERQRAEKERTRLVAEKPRSAKGRDDYCHSFMHCLFSDKPRRKTKQIRVTKQPVVPQSTSEVVAWNDPKYRPGTLIIRTPERALYYVEGNGEAIRYSVGVGREGFQWGGQSRIVAKQEWPTWRPPQEMIKREAAKGHMLKPQMEGGPENPLGARALYIGGTMYRVHGTNNESSIGGAVSSGCIRMMNADVIDLYDRVKIGSPIYVYQ